MSKFSDFLAAKKLDARRILAASHALESLRPEDRAIKLAAKLAKKGEGKKQEGEKKKPRSGRPVTAPAIAAAQAGKAISGPQKTRLLKAVNHLLEQKKQEQVALDQLFLSPGWCPPRGQAGSGRHPRGRFDAASAASNRVSRTIVVVNLARPSVFSDRRAMLLCAAAACFVGLLVLDLRDIGGKRRDRIGG